MTNLLDAATLVEDTSIANRAMKAVFHRGMGAGRRIRDTEAERLVKDTLGDQGQVVTRKLFTNKQGLIYRRNQLANEMYLYHMKHTLALGDDGSRALSTAVYFEYVTEMGQYEGKLQVMDTQTVATYPYLVQTDINERNAALIRQGKPPTASVDDYPTADKMKQYLYVNWYVEPIATASDFRFDPGEHIKQRLTTRLEEYRSEVSLQMFERMVEPMQRFVEKLSVPIGEDGGVFRDSLIGNLNDLSYLRKMNINDDPRVNELLDGIERIIKPYVFAPDVLRQQPEARQAARDKMAELMKRLDGYGVGGAA